MLIFLLRATGVAALAALVAIVCGSLILSYHTLRLMAIAAFPDGLCAGHRWDGQSKPSASLSDEDLEERTALAIAI